MCDPLCQHSPIAPGEQADGASRRGLLGAMTLSAAAVAAGPLLGRIPAARAAADTRPGRDPSLTLLGTAGGPPPLAGRHGISSALVVNGKTYVIDCGRGAVSQYMRAGLSMPSLAGIFLTHLHSDHTVDYFSFPLLSAGVTGPQGFTKPIDVYGPGPSGQTSLLAGSPGPTPGTAKMTELANQAFATSTTFFLTEQFGIDPTTRLRVHDVMPPATSGASPADKAPTMAPFTVMENDDVKVSAILVPHGAVYPAYAYRFDTDHGSVVFSGDTAPTPNIPRLANEADILVHETADMAILPKLGYPKAVVDHIKTVHTDVTLLGGIAAAASVKALVASHISPADPNILSEAAWRKMLRSSARRAGFGGDMVLGTDLLRIPVGYPASRPRSVPAGQSAGG